MTASFHLTTQPWIPCERPDGTIVELSTHDTLAQAHHLRGLADPSPLVLAVLHRHLLAVLHRSFDGPRTMKEWKAIATPGAFDMTRIGAYLDRIHDRMDLFHPTHPFAQTRGLAARGVGVRSIERLSVEQWNWGNAKPLFRAAVESPSSPCPPPQAARALLVIHGYSLHGTVMNPADGARLGETHSASAAPLVHSAVVLLHRPTLFGTLMANSLVYDAQNHRPFFCKNDLPSWEQDPLPAQQPSRTEPRRAPSGWLDLMTWLSRRVELLVSDGHIRGFSLASGQGFPTDAMVLDPMVAYKKSEKHGWLPIGMDTERAFWRDSGALFQATLESETVRCPLTVSQIADPVVAALLGKDASVDICAYGEQAERGVKAVLNAIRVEGVWSRVAWLKNPDMFDTIHRAISRADEAIKILDKTIFIYGFHMIPEKEPKRQEMARSFEQSLNIKQAAWSAIGVAFHDFLRDLDNAPEGALDRFAGSTISLIRTTFEHATSTASTTARSLKARAIAERSLHEALKSLAD